MLLYMFNDKTAVVLKPVLYSTFDVLCLKHVTNSQVPVSLTVAVCHLPQHINSSDIIAGRQGRYPAWNRHGVTMCIAADSEDFILS